MVEQYCDASEFPMKFSTFVYLKQPTLLFGDSDKTFIYHGNEEYNAQAVKDLQIPVYEIGYEGGTIVGAAGDLSIGIFYPDTIDLRSDYILDKIVSILQNHGIAAEVDSNDVLVDDKKVSACNSISKTIEDAAQSYVYFNTDIVDSAILSDNQFEISISALQSEGLLDTDLVNPITDENITGSIIITKNDNQYIYLIPLNCI